MVLWGTLTIDPDSGWWPASPFEQVFYGGNMECIWCALFRKIIKETGVSGQHVMMQTSCAAAGQNLRGVWFFLLSVAFFTLPRREGVEVFNGPLHPQTLPLSCPILPFTLSPSHANGSDYRNRGKLSRNQGSSIWRIIVVFLSSLTCRASYPTIPSYI